MTPYGPRKLNQLEDEVIKRKTCAMHLCISIFILPISLQSTEEEIGLQLFTVARRIGQQIFTGWNK